ncbi:MAG: glycerophosphodiester phosphodiesterase family protein [Chitinophagaceae bacterium]
MKNLISSLIVVCLLACSSAKNSMSNVAIQLPDFDKEGHRGCRGLMPENTIPAMLHALEIGVTTLEMDACITKDRKVIISHDPYFNHEITTKSDGSFIDANEEKEYKLYGMTYAETQQYDVGLKFYERFPKQQKIAVHKPLLSDLIDSVKKYATQHKTPLPFFNIETKTQPSTDNVFHPGPEEFVDLLMYVIIEEKIEPYVIIQSFDFRTLRYLHTKYPTIRTAMLIDDSNKSGLVTQINDLGFTPTIYSPAYQLVNTALVNQCKDEGMKIIPWTVNDKSKIEELKQMGVDGIISDYPDLF